MLRVEHEAGHRARALVLENERGELPQERIALPDRGICGALERFDGERRDADGIVRSDRVEDVLRARLITPHLWDEERVAAPRVLPAPRLKIAKIDVRAEQI